MGIRFRYLYKANDRVALNARMLRVALLACVLGLALATPAVVRSRNEIQAFRSYLENTRTSECINIYIYYEVFESSTEVIVY